MEKKLCESYNNWELAVEDILLKIVNTSNEVLLQIGHFSLLYNQFGELIPAIKEEIADEELRKFVSDSNYMNDFPLKTFTEGITIASKLRDKRKKITFSFIVNDWQWIHKGLYAFPTDRRAFYKKKQLPLLFEKLLDENSFSKNDILRTNHYVKDGIYFSEQKLRKTEKKETIKICSPTSCTIEYSPFLKICLEKIDTFISFIPMSCQIPILYSTINYIKTENSDVNILHIFYDPQTKNIESSFINKKNLTESLENEVNERYKIMERFSE